MCRQRALTTLLLAAICRPALCDTDYIRQELPTPGSVDETVEPMEFAFRRLGRGELKLGLRNYYFDRSRDTGHDSEAWAQGASLAYVSPLWTWFTVFIGLNLLQSAFTKKCPAAWVFSKLGVKSGNAFE